MHRRAFSITGVSVSSTSSIAARLMPQGNTFNGSLCVNLRLYFKNGDHDGMLRGSWASLS